MSPHGNRAVTPVPVRATNVQQPFSIQSVSPSSSHAELNHSSHSRSVSKAKFSAKPVFSQSSENTISAIITGNGSSNYRGSIKG